MPLHAHPLVVKIAMETAEHLFEDYAERNDWYRQFKQRGGSEKRARRIFVSKVAPRLFEQARKALVDILAGPYSEEMKQEAYEALCLDNHMRANRHVAAVDASVPTRLH